MNKFEATKRFGSRKRFWIGRCVDCEQLYVWDRSVSVRVESEGNGAEQATKCRRTGCRGHLKRSRWMDSDDEAICLEP